MKRPALLAASLAVAGFATATAAVAAGAAPSSAPPAGALQFVLQPQSFHFQDNPPRSKGAPAASPGDGLISTYRVLDAAGAQRIGRAQFVCVATDRRGEHEQCAGTIALADGQLATQGDADHVAVVGGTGAYAGARGTASGEDHEDRVDVTVRFLP